MAEAQKTIWLLCANDFHAELEESEGTPGSEKFAAAVQAFKAAHPGTFVLFGGDNYRGDPVADYLDGAPVSRMMALLGTKASAIGNHEYDAGMDAIYKWQEEGGYRFVAANLVDKRTGARPQGIDPCITLEHDGLRVLVIGLSMEETLGTADRPPQMADYGITHGSTAAQRIVTEAMADPATRPNAVVALTHYPLKYRHGTEVPEGDELLELCNTVPGIHGVFTGHLHQFMALTVNGVAVAQGGSSAKGFAWLRLDFGAGGTLHAATPGYEDLRPRRQALVPDAGMHRIREEARRAAMPVLGRVVTRLPRAILHRNADTFEVDPEGSPLSDLATRVMCKAGGCEIALFYAGRIGRQLPAGDITLYQLYKTLFFENGVITLWLSGRDILRNVEIGIRTLRHEGASPLALRGLRVEADYAKPYLHRVESITLANGQPLEMDTQYHIAVDDFLAGSPMGFDFTNATGVQRTGLSARQGMIDALRGGQLPDYDFEKTLTLRNKDI